MVDVLLSAAVTVTVTDVLPTGVGIPAEVEPDATTMPLTAIVAPLAAEGVMVVLVVPATA